MIELREPYRPRAVRFLEEWRDAGWRLKVYGIAYIGERPRAELIETAKRIARERLPQPAVTESRYGVGFLGVHDGRTANFVFVDWWADENELHHHVYSSASDELENLSYVTPTGLSACVWDLRVQSFEREAWLEEVLKSARGANVEGYMARRLSEDV
jgi:prepilin-type processing-associated H-X9-DG protein